MFAVGFFATLCLVLPYVTSESPDKGTEILGYVASLLTVAFRFLKKCHNFYLYILLVEPRFRLLIKEMIFNELSGRGRRQRPLFFHRSTG